MRSPDPYGTLGVERNADHLTIRSAYRALAWTWHPDRGATPRRMVEINAAWRILGNPDRRAAYDANLAPATSVASPAAVHEDRGAFWREPTIDFGRYQGWTIADLVRQDPDYLEWLARMPAGRHLAPEIKVALDERARQVADLAPRPTHRRGLFRPAFTGAR